jgi:hypothetical protein
MFLRRVLSTSLNSQAGGPPLVGYPRLLIQHIPSYPPYWRPFLHPQPEVAPCRGDRDPLISEDSLLCLYDLTREAVQSQLKTPYILLSPILTDTFHYYHVTYVYASLRVPPCQVFQLQFCINCSLPTLSTLQHLHTQNNMYIGFVCLRF